MRNRIITKCPNKNQNFKKEAKNKTIKKETSYKKTKLQFRNYAKTLVY